MFWLFKATPSTDTVSFHVPLTVLVLMFATMDAPVSVIVTRYVYCVVAWYAWNSAVKTYEHYLKKNWFYSLFKCAIPDYMTEIWLSLRGYVYMLMDADAVVIRASGKALYYVLCQIGAIQFSRVFACILWALKRLACAEVVACNTVFWILYLTQVPLYTLITTTLCLIFVLKNTYESTHASMGYPAADGMWI